MNSRSKRHVEVLAEAAVASVPELQPRDPVLWRKGLCLVFFAIDFVLHFVQVSWAYVYLLSDAVQALLEACHVR